LASNQPGITTPSAAYFFIPLFSGLRIRQILLLIISVLSLIAISAISWSAIQVLNQNEVAEQLVWDNAAVEQALSLNILLARERGFTAGMLANSEYYNSETRQDLLTLREKTDKSLRLLQGSLKGRSGMLGVVAINEQLEVISRSLADNRQKVDLSLDHHEITITANGWVAAVTRYIENVYRVSRTISAPVNEEGRTAGYGIASKEIFFSLSEDLGRDRALLSMVIAQHRPLLPNEYEQLSNYQYGIQAAFNKIDRMLLNFPRTSAITLARLELQHTYKREYQTLRDDVIQSSQAGRSYPVNTVEWFGRATKGVDAVLRLSSAIDLHINRDIKLIKSNADNTMMAFFAVLVLVMIVFAFAFIVIHRRILVPLGELEFSAKTIGNGDFSRATQISGHDEFCEVAEAFEIMRVNLIDDRRERSDKAEDELRKLSTAIEQSVSSIIMTDTAGIIEYVNPQFYRTTGYNVDEIIGYNSSLLNSGETDEITCADLWSTIKQGLVWHGELLNKKKNGELYWEMVSISPVRNRDDKITHFISIQHDISKRKALEERLNFMAYHDKLTELPNRALLADRFTQVVAHAQRHEGTKVALLMMDLDRFKVINDSLGHSAGDQLLIEVAKRLKHATRSCDTLSRHGGDEFVMLIEDIVNIEDLVDIVKRLEEALVAPFIINEQDLHISGSMGISIWPDDGKDMDTLLTKADTAMYHSKEEGGEKFQFFTSEMNKKISQRLHLENDLRKAIDNQEFELYYQPQVCLTSGRLTGTEALIRWNHPERGLIPPVQFIPLAEDTNLIKPIGLWVLQTACQQLVKWKKAGQKEMSMAVNVSVRQLDDPHFIAGLTAALQESGLDPADLEIEITESAVMSQPEKMLDVLNAIKRLGVKLALDDFGTGYSSLSYLRDFPFDKLKIDRSFIKDIVEKPEDLVIAEAITTMAHTLNMRVLAEGVETDVQASHVRSCFCDEMQGYLISRPVPAGELEQLMHQKHHAFAEPA